MASATEAQSQPLLVRFFDPKLKDTTDPKGRTLDDILSFSDDQLEASHNYIQIIFPLPEGSPFNSSAPIITKEVCEVFRARPELRERVKEAFGRMMAFYGFRIDSEADAVTLHRDARIWKRNSSDWVTRFDHNHLRITRILRSLRVLGLEEEANAFYVALLDDEISGKVSPKSRMYWKRAARRALHLPPDEDDDDAEGIKWLVPCTSSASFGRS